MVVRIRTGRPNNVDREGMTWVRAGCGAGEVPAVLSYCTYPYMVGRQNASMAYITSISYNSTALALYTG